ncbi:MAG: serine/threonine-protein kinase [Acidiferrobacterales bacterium]
MGGYHKDALPRGHHLVDYEIESLLGFGGFGITYLAHDSQLGAKVAIKEYLPQDISGRVEATKVFPNPDAPNAFQDYHLGLKEFLKEARHLVRFKHPNIVRVLRYMEANGTAYMVMEYEEGESLGEYLKRKPGRRLEEKEFLRIFLPVFNGLGAVHADKILHLDIKPDNIYLRKDHTPMLIDFGSARQAITGPDHMQRITLTHGYAPIEQYPGKGDPGPWTDIYAAGASMYFCICGKRPEISINRYQTILKHHVDPLVPATKIGDGHYSRYILECIDWALQIYASDRPQSARELQDALMGKGIPKPGQVKPSINISGPAYLDTQQGEGRAGRWIVILLVLGILGGGYYLKPNLAKEVFAQSGKWVKGQTQELVKLLKR